MADLLINDKRKNEDFHDHVVSKKAKASNTNEFTENSSRGTKRAYIFELYYLCALFAIFYILEIIRNQQCSIFPMSVDNISINSESESNDISVAETCVDESLGSGDQNGNENNLPINSVEQQIKSKMAGSSTCQLDVIIKFEDRNELQEYIKNLDSFSLKTVNYNKN